MVPKQSRFLPVLLGSMCILIIFSTLSWSAECQNWQTSHPEWIFCDDFESTASLVGTGRYFEYDNNNGDFIVTNSVGLSGSRAMRALWQTGETDAGHLALGFGKNPNSYMNKNIRPTENFKEVYYRMYLKMDAGWQGNPYKLSRATIFTDTNWSQAMIAHLWQGTGNLLAIDPVSCVGADNSVVCRGYNNFANMKWLGLKSGITPIFDSSNSDKWFCIESHVKLNDAGQSNGVQEFWIDGQLEARRDLLNFVGSYSTYGINAIFFENYWNSSATRQQGRLIDNIVVSTQRIGCVGSQALGPPQNLRIAP